jgi:hypothetical protein
MNYETIQGAASRTFSPAETTIPKEALNEPYTSFSKTLALERARLERASMARS